jgi:hypothetical protein
MTAFVCGYGKYTAYLATVALIRRWRLLCPLPWQIIVSYLPLSAIIASSFATPTASTTDGQDGTDGDESEDNDELHNDEEEDEMLRMTDTLTKIMV